MVVLRTRAVQRTNYNELTEYLTVICGGRYTQLKLQLLSRAERRRSLHLVRRVRGTYVFVPLQVVGYLDAEGEVEVAVHNGVPAHAGAQALLLLRQQRGARAARPQRAQRPQRGAHVGTADTLPTGRGHWSL